MTQAASSPFLGRTHRLVATALLAAAAGTSISTVCIATELSQLAHKVSTTEDDQYVPGPDSMPQPGVPRGQLIDFEFDQSRIFAGTKQKITLYIPAEYTAAKPACLYVGLDGLSFSVPTVFDNLIYSREMPVTIAIGIAPGVVDSAAQPRNPRFDRSVEFDGLNGDLGRFVMDELIPEVERRKTPDGLPILLSKDPNDHAAGGASTGGIGAFTLAWEPPQAFRRIFTGIGTFVGMRGGDRYPVLIRKTEPKPIRIFMQDGSHDEWTGGPEVGDWWLGNQAMQSALSFAGYQVQHVWGEGTHNGAQANAVFPDAIRWLWKDWPQPVTTDGHSGNRFLNEILLPSENWQAAPPDDADARRLLRAPPTSQKISGVNGHTYMTDTTAGKVWLLHNGHERALLDTGLNAPTGLALSPDGLWLAVAESHTHWGYSYRVQPDGTVQAKQRFYWFHVPDDADDSGAGAWVFDRDGRLYSATRMGVQVFDRNGRVRLIMPLPSDRPIALSFGGSSYDLLYVLCADRKVYRRKLNVRGVPPGSPPLELPPWGPG
jgi:gluconolactonase